MIKDGAKLPCVADWQKSPCRELPQGDNRYRGIVCGEVSGVTVIDLDRHALPPDAPSDAPEPPDGIRAWVDAFGDLPPTMIVITRSGGLHLYFKHDPRITGNARGSLPRGIDVRGGGKGFVMAPGSPGWALSDTKGDPEILPIPEAVLKMILTPKERRRSPEGEEDRSYEMSSDTSRYGKSALASACSEIRSAQVGSRNETLNRESFSIYQLVAGGEIAPEDADRELTSAAVSTGLTDHEIHLTLDSARKSGMSTPRAPAQRPSPRPGAKPPPQPPAEEDTGDPIPPVEYHEEAWADYTQQGFASLIVKSMGGDFIWLVDRQCWAHYDGSLWVVQSPRDTVAQQQIAQQIAQEVSYYKIPPAFSPSNFSAKEIEAVSKALKAWKKAAKSDSFQTGAIHQARAMPEVAQSGVTFDNQEIIATPSGAYDLPELKRRRLKKADFSTRALGVEPAPGRALVWNKFLNEITLNDEDLKLYLQCLAGYCLTPWLVEPALLICYGVGGNGKTTFWNVISAVAGSYAVFMPKESVIKCHGSNVRNWNLPRLEGARLAIVAETSTGDLLDEGKIKPLTGAEKIVAEEKFGTPYEVTPRAKWIVYTNADMRVPSEDTGTWRRMSKIPFRYQVPPNKKLAPQVLMGALLAELPAIAAWALEGLKMFIDLGHKLPPCAAVSSSTKDYRYAENEILRFIASKTGLDKCQVTLGDQWQIRGKEYYTAYLVWADQEGIRRPIGSRAFYESLTYHGMILDRDDKGQVFITIDPQKLERI